MASDNAVLSVNRSVPEGPCTSDASGFWDALERLLDDPDPVVRKALTRFIESNRDAAIGWLGVVAGKGDAGTASIAADFLLKAGLAEPEIEWQRWLQGDRSDLESGILCLQRMAQPQWRAEPLRAELRSYAGRVRALVSHPCSGMKRAQAVNRVLFGMIGFRVTGVSPSRPGPLLIGEVLASRRADPVGISLLYLLVARRAGLELLPIFLGGRLQLVCLRQGEPFLIDPADRGAIKDWQAMQSLCSIDALQVLQRPDWCPADALLRSLCLRLTRRYISRGDLGLADRFRAIADEMGCRPLSPVA